MKISEMDFGSLDAKNEIINHGVGGDKKFINSFVAPPRFAAKLKSLDRLRYITGLKGTGKTALLRFLAINEKKIADSLQHFVIFRKSLSDEEKAHLSGGIEYKVASSSIIGFEYEQNFEHVWMWFFHREICDLLKQEGADNCFDKAGTKRYVDFISALTADEDKKEGWLTSLIPRLKSGGFKVGLDVGPITAEFAGELDLSKNTQILSLSKIVEKSNKILMNMKAGTKAISIFIDEIEISLSNSSVFKRDCLMVRDLIVAISSINEIFWRINSTCKIVAALRSEVLSAVDQFGKETNKLVSDFGFDVRWNVTDNAFEHPLFVMINAKINGLGSSAPMGPTKFFSSVLPSKINGISTWDYILHRTWYRPRDLVRFFTSLKDSALERNEEAEVFTEDDLIKGCSQYSRESWKEIGEELRAQFTPDGVRLIKEIFTGYRTHFSYAELCKRIDHICGREKSSFDIFGGLSIREFLRSLYRVGIIGNEYKSNGGGKGGYTKQAWSHKGDVDLLFERMMMIHRGLHKIFKLERPVT